MYIIRVDPPFDATQFVGPFSTLPEALAWARQSPELATVEWTWANLWAPSKYKHSL